MYCIKCGVELADSEKKCPLCGTVVYHPDVKQAEVPPTFPDNRPVREEFNRKGVLFILTFIFVIPQLLTLICDLSLNAALTWSGYTVSSIALAYLLVVLPIWFKKPNPVIFVAADYIGGEVFLLYINYLTGGKWFLTFAMPVVAMAAFVTVTVIALVKYLRRGYLYIFGGAFIISGLFMMLIEALANITFDLRDYFVWSFYPLIVLGLLGIMLIIIAMCPPLRESLKKKFFI